MSSPHLQDPSLRRALFAVVRSRVPERDAEDVVQSVLIDAVASTTPPSEATDFKKWLMGIARHKVADYYRSRKREVLTGGDDDLLADSEGHDARDLLRWAQRELPEGSEARETFRTMLREGDGEKLEHVAEEVAVPAPRLRQRVSRLRRFFRERWALAAAAAIGVAVILVVALRKRATTPTPIAHELPAPIERARALRRDGLELCREAKWASCVAKLDEARALDGEGDALPDVQDARNAADRALTPPPAPPRPAPAPSASMSPPRPMPTETAAPRATPGPTSLSTPPAPPRPMSGSSL